MTTIDRYVLRLFVKVLVVLFCSLAGLSIMIDVFTNFSDFDALITDQGLLVVMAGYYGARLIVFFERTAALFCLLAVMFSMAWLQRCNELTALMAGGVPKRRILRPLIAATVLISLLAAASRELIIPHFQYELTRDAQNWDGRRELSLKPHYDRRTNILLNGQHGIIAQQKIVQPTFRLHTPLGQFDRQLSAQRAFYRERTAQHPAGYLLIGVEQPSGIDQLATALLDGEPVIYAPGDTPWLEPRQCFVVSDVELTHLIGGGRWAQYNSTRQLVRALHNPSVHYGADVRVTLHSRIVQPVLDVTLLFLGLPLVLARHERNVFVVAGLGLVVVLVFYLVVLACYGLGANGYLVSPSLAAWLPLLLFIPVAYNWCRAYWE